jgi:trk/ktr system potassium uptake protein
MKNLYIKLESIKKNPYMIFVITFVVIIFLGAILLNLPISNNNGKSIGFVDALFTSTSAMCVTGLTVVNTAEYWTVFGKIVILILIQMGGLGVMTMSAMISFFLGKKITLKTRVFIMEERNVDELQGVVRLTKSILVYTFLVEFIGAVLLSPVFIKDYGVGKGIAYSIFHSISAFCNAGFDIT